MMNGNNATPTIGGIPLGDLFEMRHVDSDEVLDQPIYASAPLPDGSMTKIVSASTVGEYGTLAMRLNIAKLEAHVGVSGDVHNLIALLRSDCERGMLP